MKNSEQIQLDFFLWMKSADNNEWTFGIMMALCST